MDMIKEKRSSPAYLQKMTAYSEDESSAVHIPMLSFTLNRR